MVKAINWDNDMYFLYVPDVVIKSLLLTDGEVDSITADSIWDKMTSAEKNLSAVATMEIGKKPDLANAGLKPFKPAYSLYEHTHGVVTGTNDSLYGSLSTVHTTIDGCTVLVGQQTDNNIEPLLERIVLSFGKKRSVTEVFGHPTFQFLSKC